MTTILAVDPSIRNVGWALLHCDSETNLQQWYGGCLNYCKDYEIEDLCYSICVDLDGKVIRHSIGSILLPSVVIVEKPVFMSGPKGHIAAQKGYTLDLAFIVGYIVRHYRQSQFKPRIKLYRPFDWKGQVPKSATLAKFKRIFPGEKIPKTDHEVDARMMIVHYLASK